MDDLPEELLIVIITHLQSSYYYCIYCCSRKFRKCLKQVYDSMPYLKVFRWDLLACLIFGADLYSIVKNCIFLNTIGVLLTLDEVYSSYSMVHIIDHCCKNSHLPVITHIHKNNKLDMNYVLQRSCLSHNQDIIQYALNNGADNYDKAALIAATKNNGELVKRMVNLGIKDYSQILTWIVINGNIELFCYITNLLPFHDNRKMYNSLLRTANRKNQYEMDNIISVTEKLPYPQHSLTTKGNWCEIIKIISEWKRKDQIEFPRLLMKKRKLKRLIKHGDIESFRNTINNVPYINHQKECDSLRLQAIYEEQYEIANIIYNMSLDYTSK